MEPRPCRDAAAEAETQLSYLRRAGDLAPFYREQWRGLVGSEIENVHSARFAAEEERAQWWQG